MRTRSAVVLVLILRSAASVVSAETCRQLDASELPLIGGLGGVWLTSSRVALTDVQEERFLVYALDGGKVRGVVPRASGHGPLRILDAASVRDGFLMGSMYQNPNRFQNGSFVLRFGVAPV